MYSPTSPDAARTRPLKGHDQPDHLRNPDRDPHHRSRADRDPTLQGTIRGLVAAVTRCGPWPVVGTLDEYQAALDCARLEVDHTVRLADRYWARYRRAALRVPEAADQAGIGVGMTRNTAARADFLRFALDERCCRYRYSRGIPNQAGRPLKSIVGGAV